MTDEDLVHASKHGTKVIPKQIVDKIPEVIGKLLRGESFVIKAARQKGGIGITQLNESWEKFANAIKN